MASVKMNSSTSTQPAMYGSTRKNRMGFRTRKPMMVCLYQSGELPRKFRTKPRLRESVMVIIRWFVARTHAPGFHAGARKDVGFYSDARMVVTRNRSVMREPESHFGGFEFLP